MVDVVERTDRRHRHLGRSVHPGHRGLLEIVCCPADQRRRHRRAAADEHLQIRQPGARSLGGGQQTVEKRCGTRHVGAAFRQHQRHRGVRVPALHQHRGGAEQQRAFERVDRSADVRDRRRHEERVAVGHQPVLADLADQRVDRIMGVQNTLRPPGRAGGVEDHAHRVGIQHGQHRCGVRASNSARTACDCRASPRTTTTSGGDAIDAVTRSSMAA